MKKIHIYILLTVSLLVTHSSCDSFLDTKPYSNTVVDNFYKTADDAELALTGCYQTIMAAVMQGEWGRASFNSGMQAMLEGGTDECIQRDGLADPLFGGLAVGSYTAQHEMFKFSWSFLFKGVSRTNFLLDNIGNINDLNEDRRDEIIAEARFLRGFYYYYLGILYGAAPVYTSSDQDPMAPRDSLQSVFERAIEDFTHAYEVLPDRASIEGRANKWSSAGFLVKTYNYLASCKMNNVGADLNFELNSFDWVNSNEFYQKSKTISQDIIDNGGYILTKNYDRLFRETTDTYQYEECLFTGESTPMQAVGEDYGVWLFYLIPVGATNVTGGGYGWYRPTAEMFYDLYDSHDLRLSHNIGGMLVDKNDQTEIIDGVRYYVPQPAIPDDENYCITKYRYRDPKTKQISMAQTEGNYPILRFADILLLNAEAEYFTGDESKARERLSEVRWRVSKENLGGTSPELKYLNDRYKRTDFLTELLEERSRELCFEAQRRPDLIRFGKLQEAISKLSNGKTEGKESRWNVVVPILQENWENASYKIWYPLPINDVLLNGNLIQNPGYQSK